MERIIEKIEKIIEAQIEAFEKNPITTSLKLLLFYWVFKKLYTSAKRGWTMWNLIKVAAFLAMIKYFILDSLPIKTFIEDSGHITAIICCFLVVVAIAIPCIIADGKEWPMFTTSQIGCMLMSFMTPYLYTWVIISNPNDDKAYPATFCGLVVMNLIIWAITSAI